MVHHGRVKRAAALTMAIGLLVAGCGSATTPSGASGDAPATAGVPSEAPASGAPASADASASPGPAASGLIDYPTATDPAAGGRLELDLAKQLRDEAGLSALLGPGGSEAFTALDAIEAGFGLKVLQDAASLVDGTAATAGTTAAIPVRLASDTLEGQLASTDTLGVTPTRVAAIDISLFADTGFTANALMGMFAGIVRQAASDGRGTLPRAEHFTDDSGGLHQEVDLQTTLTVQTGGGRASGDIRMSATDRISRSDGTFVALYTSSAEGHFDVNACPDAGGIAEGTYSFATKHELNDVSGAANAQSGAGRSVEAPFKLVDGDDAKLTRIEASLQMDADARGPGSPSGPGPTAPFAWTASQQLGIVMPVGGGTTGSGAAPTVSGTGGDSATGAMFVSSAMAQLFLGAIGSEAERFWRSGECIELKPSRDSGQVQPSEKIELTVDAKAKFGDHADVKGPIVAKFTGKKSVDPHDQPVDAPAHFSFEAGTEEGDVGTIALEQTSRRGIGKRQVVYTVGQPLKLSLSSKSVARPATIIVVTYTGMVKDLPLKREGDAYVGKGKIKFDLTYKLTAAGAKCTGKASRTYEIDVRGVPVPEVPDQIDITFAYPIGLGDQFTITCVTRDGTGTGAAPPGGLIFVLPPPGIKQRLRVDATTRIVVPGDPPITIDYSVTKEK